MMREIYSPRNISASENFGVSVPRLWAFCIRAPSTLNKYPHNLEALVEGHLMRYVL